MTEEREQRCGTCKWWIPNTSREGVCFGDDSTRQASEVCLCWTSYRATQEAVVDAAAHIDHPGPIPETDPADPGKEV